MRKSYKGVCNEINESMRLKTLYDNLHKIGGIALSKVEYYDNPHVSSNYRMGEYVEVRVNGVLIDKRDYCMEYSRSCKWSARHGRIVINFTKKGLKEYVSLCEKLSMDSLDRLKRLALLHEKVSLLKKYIDERESVYNRSYMIIN